MSAESFHIGQLRPAAPPVVSRRRPRRRRCPWPRQCPRPHASQRREPPSRYWTLHHGPGRGTCHGRHQCKLAWHMLVWNKRSAGLGCWLRAARCSRNPQAVTGSGLGDRKRAWTRPASAFVAAGQPTGACRDVQRFEKEKEKEGPADMRPRRRFRPTRFGHGECDPAARDPDASSRLTWNSTPVSTLADVAALGNQFLFITSACKYPALVRMRRLARTHRPRRPRARRDLPLCACVATRRGLRAGESL